MYRFRERRHSHRKFFIALGCFLLLVLFASALLIRLIKPETHIGKTPAAVVSSYGTSSKADITISNNLFSLQLPAGWITRPLTTNDIPRPTYSWIGGTGDTATQWVNLYIDTVPTDMAVNLALPVQSSGAGLAVVGNVSDNCTDFTRPTAAETKAGKASAKWEGTNFVCDLANYQRDVVGTTSVDGLNTVTVTGSATGAHRIFMTYTDNSPSPNYGIFEGIIRSFTLK